MITINAYPTFNGNCLDAFNHYQKVFGGEFEAKQFFKDKFGIQWMMSFSEPR